MAPGSKKSRGRSALKREANFWRPIGLLDYADVESLRGFELPETALVDFKRIDVLLPVPGKSVVDEITPHLCALANAGGGRLVFGAETDKSDRMIQRFRGLQEASLRAVLSR